MQVGRLYTPQRRGGQWMGDAKEDGTSIQVFLLIPELQTQNQRKTNQMGGVSTEAASNDRKPKRMPPVKQHDNVSGTVPPGFTLTWVKQEPIKKVHLLFMNHLDVGYAIHLYEGNPYGFISNVLNTYQREYILKRAISLQKDTSSDEPPRKVHLYHTAGR